MPAACHGARVVVAAAVAAGSSCAVALLLAGGGPVVAAPGLPDAGAATGWALRGTRLMFDLAGCLTVGSLLLHLLVGSSGFGPAGDAASRAWRAARWWATVWAACAVALFGLTAADTVGVPLDRVNRDALGVIGSTAPGRALVLVAMVAALLAVSVRHARSSLDHTLLLGLALAGLLPVPIAGHAVSATDHDLAVSGVVVHVVAASLWVGGLAAILLYARWSPTILGGVVRRFSVLALGCYVCLAGSGLIIAGTRLGTSTASWTSGYGALVAVKGVALVVLGVLGLAHRRRTMPRLMRREPRAFVRLAGAELVLMASAMGLAAALARTPPPPRTTTTPTHGSGHPTLAGVIDPIAWDELVFAWRPNALVLLVLAGAAVAYVQATRELARSGRHWPRSRTGAFAAGLVLALLASCSGIATYAPAMVSVQIAQLLLVLLPVPALLALGAPVTLWAQVRESRGKAPTSALTSAPAGRVLTDPYTGAALVCALLLALYRSPLVEVSLRSTWIHLLVLAVALASGLVMMTSVLGVDALAATRSRSPFERAMCVAAVAGCLGILAVQLGFGDRLLAGTWFLELRWRWVDPVVDQRVGGALIGACALALLILTAVLGRRQRQRA